MIEIGAVGATFTLEDLVSPVLTRISEGFERLDTLIASVKEGLASITLPPGLLGEKPIWPFPQPGRDYRYLIVRLSPAMIARDKFNSKRMNHAYPVKTYTH